MCARTVNALLLLAACSKDVPRDPCVELHALTTSGVVLSEDPDECRDMLAFATGPIVADWPSFQAWLDEVPLQRTELKFDLVRAMAESDWAPAAFDRFPSEVPCGTGISVSDASWASSKLAEAGLARPKRLYVSVSLAILARDEDEGKLRVDVRTYQDFDCDGDVAESTLQGIVRRGRLVFKGGWTPESGTYAPVHE